MGRSYENSRNFADAIKIYTKDIKAKPEHPSSYVKIADCLRKLNMLDDAISFLEDAKKTDY